MGRFENRERQLPVLAGLAGFILLNLLFITLITIFNSFTSALERYLFRWYFYIPITMGFGLQLGIFFFMRIRLKQEKVSKSALVTTGGVSSGTMLLCCTHYIANVIPFMAISGFSIFFIKYEVPFLLLGLFSNIIGITIMLYYIQKYNIAIQNRLLLRCFNVNMKKVVYIGILFSSLFLVGVFAYYSLIY